jgi:hypothetical protein
MKKLFRSILSSNRKRRNLTVSAALWLLRQVRDVEEDEMRRYEGELYKLDSEPVSVSKREYAAIEDEYTECEYALGVIDYAIEDLELAYCERF